LNPRPLGYEQADRRPGPSSLLPDIAGDLGRSAAQSPPVSPVRPRLTTSWSQPRSHARAIAPRRAEVSPADAGCSRAAAGGTGPAIGAQVSVLRALGHLRFGCGHVPDGGVLCWLPASPQIVGISGHLPALSAFPGRPFTGPPREGAVLRARVSAGRWCGAGGDVHGAASGPGEQDHAGGQRPDREQQEGRDDGRVEEAGVDGQRGRGHGRAVSEPAR